MNTIEDSYRIGTKLSAGVGLLVFGIFTGYERSHIKLHDSSRVVRFCGRFEKMATLTLLSLGALKFVLKMKIAPTLWNVHID